MRRVSENILSHDFPGNICIRISVKSGYVAKERFESKIKTIFGVNKSVSDATYGWRPVAGV